jgi:hypothetical protein
MKFWAALVASLCLCAAHSAVRAQEVPCAFLSPVDPALLPEGYLPEGEACIERERFEIDGRQYIFADVVGYDRGYADRQFALTREAVWRAVPLYARWFEVPDALFIFGRAPDASAQAETIGRRAACVVRVDDIALRQGIAGDSSDDQFRRAIAHEIFHCVQTHDATLDNDYVVWRDEASAEYFAGLAVPDSLPGPQLYNEFDALIGETPLYQLDFNGYPFMAFLGNEGGPEAVIAFLHAARATPGEAGALAHLGYYPGIAELFHRFARAWADGGLRDDQGRPLPLGPPPATVLAVERGLTVETEIRPFTIWTQPLSLAATLAWGFPAPGFDGRAALNEGIGLWQDLEATVDSCREAKDVLLLATTTAPADSPIEVTFEIVERPELVRDCPCPEGFWTLAGEALAATGFGGAGLGSFEGGTLVLMFAPGGHTSATFNDITYYVDDGAIKMRTKLSGSVHWQWRRLPWGAAGIGPPPTGPGIEAMAIERTLLTSGAQTTVQFLDKHGSVVGEKTTPSKLDQSGGGKNLVAALCAGDALTLIGSRASPFPGNTAVPPYTGTYQR